jgi:hypothetical protein
MEALHQGVEKATISPVVKDNAIHIPAQAAFIAAPKVQRILNAPFGGPQGGAVPPKSIPEPPHGGPQGGTVPPKSIPQPKPGGPQGGAVPPHQSLPESHRPSGRQGGIIHPAASPPDYVLTPENYKDWIAKVRWVMFDNGSKAISGGSIE